VQGVLLSGSTGVGKTTLQDRLVSEHGAWTPRTYTTRQVAPHESGVEQLTADEFGERVRSLAIVLPHHFGGAWYGWPAEDLDRLRAPGRLAALNVRPYTALALAALIPDLLPVWLHEAAEVLSRRRAARAELRDTDELASLRLKADQDDIVYAALFPIKLQPGPGAIEFILSRLELG
jgi:guanylate kinase